MSILDFLVGNEDRHLNNFGVLFNGKDYKLAPLFDFGLGLFEHDRRYESEPFRECLQLMESKPFHRNNEEVINFIRANYGVDKYLPKKFDLRKCEFPSLKAESYLLNRCKILNVELEI